MLNHGSKRHSSSNLNTEGNVEVSVVTFLSATSVSVPYSNWRIILLESLKFCGVGSFSVLCQMKCNSSLTYIRCDITVVKFQIVAFFWVTPSSKWE